MKAFILTLCLCLHLVTTAAANVSLMPIRDLRPGMQGIGKTVIQGDTIEEFNAEILGVQGNEATGYSIFVRLYGDLIEKTGGVAQGMSGSPLLQNGKLIGAVTHVLVDDPTKGYAIFAENMLVTAQSVAENNKLKDAS